MTKKLLIFTILYLSTLSFLIAQPSVLDETIQWSDFQQFNMNDASLKVLYFTDAINAPEFGLLPVYSRLFRIEKKETAYSFNIINTVYQEFDNQLELQDVEDIHLIPEQLTYSSSIAIIRNRHYAELTILPLRKNIETGLIEKLISFQIEIVTTYDQNATMMNKSALFTNNSVLSEGDWFKISVSKNGIYKLTYSDLTAMGMNLSGVNPDHIRIFGNGGGMLPEKNSDARRDDLQEIAIAIYDGNDGNFDEGDYILFYAEGPDKWSYVPIYLAFKFDRHKYSDYNYYFVTVKEGQGKRISPQKQVLTLPIHEVTSYNYYETFDLDSINLIKSGSEWYSHEFFDVTHRTYTFDFPYRNVNENVFISIDVAARSFVESFFDIYANEELLFNLSLPKVTPTSTRYASEFDGTRRLIIPGNQSISFDVVYNKSTQESYGWLNYIDVNVINRLEYHGSQMSFRNVMAMYLDTIARFKMTNVNSQVTIWDVTDHQDVRSINFNMSGDTCSFVSETNLLREFIAFDHTEFYSVEILGKISNQNLHALGEADFIIVSHSDFFEQAERLKALHETIDNMTVHLVDPQNIYNEFSSGKPDPSAIRDFVRMIYQKSPETPRLKYLLLFGDGSYDPKNRIENNKNFILTFQSKQSLIFTTSYVTDDFYGLMDENEGADAAGNLDIGIGRFPVNTLLEAKQLVDKYERYMTLSPDNEGQWRNDFCFIADDEDNNLHIINADTVLVKLVRERNKTININKIYFDAYHQEKTSAGDRFPDATIAINEQMNRGALFVNYIGHGGEIALAHERVVQIQDILSWNNHSKLPVMITATCAFTPYDNPSLVSAGENVILNPNGGAIALMSTTRVAFASYNLTINMRIYDTLFSASTGQYPRVGDLIMCSKVPNNVHFRNFTLFGNPALKIAFPESKIIIDSINGKPATIYRDTLKAGDHVKFSGYIADHDINTIHSNFNGTLFPVLYDKAKKISTLANDPASMVYQFDLQQEIIYKGMAEVKNGRFLFSFVIPQDIMYNYGAGKLSLYASDGQHDAAGYFNNLILGGYLENIEDQSGPDIELYLNSKTFYDGCTTHNSPTLYVDLYDESGINHLGIGIGHDIVANLDGPVNDSFILNDYYVPQVNDFRSGSIVFPLNNLPNGQYNLRLKAWDVVNNSSVATISFIISDNIKTNITQVFNYPNPVREYTYFTFQHNQFDSPLTIKINIHDFTGKLVHTIGPIEIVGSGYNIEPIYWNGEANNTKLKSGLYVYRIEVTSALGGTSVINQKLIISN